MPPAAASLPLAPAGASARRRQSGQAIVYLVAMLPIIFLSVLVVYNTATAAREKMKLQNTADAATYSANVLTARALNYMAYTNRAMAANEASIATLASAQTSMAMLITSAANIQEGLVVAEAMKGIRNLERSRIPVVGWIYFFQYLGNIAKANRLQRTADRIAGFVEPSAKPLQIGADILRAFNQGISASQVAMLVGTTAQLPQLVKDVVNSNDPDASVPAAETAIFVIKFVADVGTYLRTYHQSGSLSFDDDEFNEVLRFAHAAQATRDDWTKNRRFLPNVLGWVASGMSGALQGMISSSPTSPPGFSDITGDMMGGLLEWKGGTELVATEAPVGDETGRIRWQSADSIEIKLPIGVLYTDLIGGWDDILRGRFGLGAGAAAAGGPNYMKSWEGQRLTLRSYAREGRTYGGLNGEIGDTAYMERESFERAARDSNGEILVAPLAVLVFNAKLHYSPRTDIGLVTKSWAMPRFTEIKDHPPMVANESDNWLAENGFKGANPLKWGKNTDKGPAFTLVVQKGGDKVRTGEVAGFGNSAADGRAGLRDNFQGREIKALSTSQVYFRRPQDRWARRDNAVADPATIGKYNVGFAGGYIEHRSLFSPYWHVHNVEPSLWARAIAMGGTAVGGSADEDNGN
ncbi:Tad domain-containing protein [Variovorax sp. IB41]|uniref:Tad domain-containing protein n=1 Tax=Variovorax sp. IB41 TaxID=2779370 RepID=UPI0018E8DC4F|nr:Tad domain-containing protein [Variovorax sp. IB41]MBJ2158961.1 Tad domain-containing protein [Variovorax sp. IB41]